MATETEKAAVLDMIQQLFTLAHIPPWTGEINDRVAEVVGLMMFETRKCSKAFAWVPRPAGGRATITWLVKQVGEAAFRAHSKMLSVQCARMVIYQWRTELDMASQDLAMERLPACRA